LYPADNDKLNPEKLFKELKEYFYYYYSQAKDGVKIEPEDKVIRKLKEIAGVNDVECSNAGNFFELSALFNNYLTGYKKCINIFTVDDSKIVNCWLGDLAEERDGMREVWGKKTAFKIKVIGNPVIRDFVGYLNGGKDSLDVGTIGSVIYYNSEAYEKKATDIWETFSKKEGIRDKKYDPSKSNRLRRQLRYKTWHAHYSDSLKEYKDDLSGAQSGFAKKAAGLLMEHNLLHELGHIYFAETANGEKGDAAKEETVAFLTELKYASLPYESLDGVTSAAWRSSMDSYRLAGTRILNLFVEYIKDRQKEGDRDYLKIVIPPGGLEKNTANLYRLTEEQVRNISTYIYQNKIR